jgi:hypothetical protein
VENKQIQQDRQGGKNIYSTIRQNRQGAIFLFLALHFDLFESKLIIFFILLYHRHHPADKLD